MPGQYEFVVVDNSVLNQLKSSWIDDYEEMADDLPLDYYEMAVNWAKTICEEKSTPASHPFTVAVVESESKVPVAIATFRVCHPKLDKSWVKVLNIVVSPKYDLRMASTAVQNTWMKGAEIGKIAGALVAGSLRKASETESKKIKFYGSNEITLNVLEMVADSFKGNALRITGLEANTQGNWLVINVS